MNAAPRILLIALLTTLMIAPSWAWGPRTQIALVTTAAHVISQEGQVPLDNLERDIRDGAAVTMETVRAIYPEAGQDIVGAIESEMYLLQAVRGDRIDPYYAFRLGLLGKMVARATAPLAEEDPTYRNLYYADVDNNIDSVKLDPAKRKHVDPRAYFGYVRREAAIRADVIVKDYQSGRGFSGVASGALAEDASRSVNAIADTWHTVLQSNVASADVSQSQVREYVLGALEFYIKRGNMQETNSTYNRVVALGVWTPELRKRVAGMFYDAEYYERAIREYRELLEETPNDREVIERIAAYYIDQGDEAMNEEKLEVARDAYQEALSVFPLHPTAQGKLLEAKRLIEEREERLANTKTALANADQLVEQADTEAARGNYAKAIELLQRAEALYGGVSNEFMVESQRSKQGLNTVARALRQHRNQIVSSADQFSGSGVLTDVDELVRKHGGEYNKEMLRQMLERELSVAEQRIRAEVSAEL